jgi:hypothetical protein
MRTPPITTPYAPDLRKVRAWLEKMIATMKFVELVVAILALIGRMRDLNTELVKRLAHLQRKRPRSETLARLEQQLVLPLMDLLTRSKPRGASDTPPKKKTAKHPGRGAPPPTSSACRCSIQCRHTRNLKSPATSNGQSLRWAGLRRLIHIRVDRLADHPLGELLEVRVQLLRERKKFRPQRSLVKRLRRAQKHRAVTALGLAIAHPSVAAAERQEQLPLPGIGDFRPRVQRTSSI